jgi:hypothetical protein
VNLAVFGLLGQPANSVATCANVGVEAKGKVAGDADQATTTAAVTDVPSSETNGAIQATPPAVTDMPPIEDVGRRPPKRRQQTMTKRLRTCDPDAAFFVRTQSAKDKRKLRGCIVQPGRPVNEELASFQSIVHG